MHKTFRNIAVYTSTVWPRSGRSTGDYVGPRALYNAALEERKTAYRQAGS